jgi:hypothetical protein
VPPLSESPTPCPRGSLRRARINLRVDTDKGSRYSAAAFRHSLRVHNIALSWQQGAVLTAVLLVLTVVLRLTIDRRMAWLIPVVQESTLIAGLYSLWQLAGTLSVLGTSGAFVRARWIERTQHSLHLPSEAAVQRAVERHPLLAEGCNYFYASMHFAMLFVVLVWLFVRHRDKYASVRTTMALTTLVCLLIQLIPVAPPRLLPGFVDTAREYGQSVYDLGLAPDQLSAMPSVHVAWAVLVAWAFIAYGGSRWRWLAIAHPVVTVFVITATANHWWLDGIVAIVVLVLCRVVQLSIRRVVVARLGARVRVPESRVQLVGGPS